MESFKQVRDYDKEPVVIEDNFSTRVFELTFLFTFDFFIIYLIFFSGIVDWTQGEWHVLFQKEMEESFRFSAILIGAFAVNVMALFSIFTKNKKYILQNNTIKRYKKLNEITSFSISDIASIKKGFFPILIQKRGNAAIYAFALFVLTIGYLALFFAKLFLWIFSFLFLRKKPYFTFLSYLLIFSKKSNSVINIHISTQNDYELLDEYFYQTKGVKLSSINTCYKIANYDKGVVNGK